MKAICEYCGYENYFDTEEDTHRVYCLHCGHYVEMYKIAEKYGVSYACVWDLIRGRSWATR